MHLRNLSVDSKTQYERETHDSPKDEHTHYDEKTPIVGPWLHSFHRMVAILFTAASATEAGMYRSGLGAHKGELARPAQGAEFA